MLNLQSVGRGIVLRSNEAESLENRQYLNTMSFLSTLFLVRDRAISNLTEFTDQMLPTLFCLRGQYPRHMEIYYVTVHCFSVDCTKDLLGGIRRDNYIYVDIAGAFLH